MISIISGTNRSNSNSFKVSGLCNDIVKAAGTESQIFSLEDLHKDFLFSEMYQEQSSEFKNQVSQYIHKADKIIFIVPEYHGSYPGVLKVFLDAISADDIMDKKTMLIGVASGHAGGIRPIGHLTEVLHHLRAEVFSRKPKLSYIDKLIAPDGSFDEKTIQNLKKQVHLFLDF